MINLIGISGRLEVGKDTVGKIIQYLTTHPNSLNKTDGKNRSYNSFLIDVGCGYEPEWKIKKFAEKLKQTASLLTGIPIEKFEDQEFKKAYLGPEWNNKYVCIGEFDKSLDDITEIKYPITVREFLQKLGEKMREVHEDIFVNSLFADYKGRERLYNEEATASDGGYYNKKIYETVFPNWIITDCRFPNEAQAIKDRGGIVVRVSRAPQSEEEAMQPTILHPSETSLDTFQFNDIITNNSSMEELIENVKIFLNKYSII